MFSDAQQRYIASLVASMRAEYPYYIAYSDYRNSSSDSPQLYIVFCKEKITSKGLYSYVVPAGVRYAVNTYNYSSYNSSSARTVVTAYSGGDFLLSFFFGMSGYIQIPSSRPIPFNLM